MSRLVNGVARDDASIDCPADEPRIARGSADDVCAARSQSPESPSIDAIDDRGTFEAEVEKRKRSGVWEKVAQPSVASMDDHGDMASELPTLQTADPDPSMDRTTGDRHKNSQALRTTPWRGMVDYMCDTGWAKGWLQGVAEARNALKRADEMLVARRERALCVSNPMAGGGPHARGGGNPAERNIIGLMQAEEEYAALYKWAKDALEEFDHMVKVNKPGFRGALADGLDVVELKYRHGMTEPEILKTLNVSRTKLYADQATLVDYLDHIGYARAMDPSINVPS